MRRWHHLDRGYVVALVMLLVLPPPFVIPIFLPRERTAELEFSMAVLALGTLVTLFLASMVAFVPPA